KLASALKVLVLRLSELCALDSVRCSWVVISGSASRAEISASSGSRKLLKCAAYDAGAIPKPTHAHVSTMSFDSFVSFILFSLAGVSIAQKVRFASSVREKFMGRNPTRSNLVGSAWDRDSADA